MLPRKGIKSVVFIVFVFFIKYTAQSSSDPLRNVLTSIQFPGGDISWGQFMDSLFIQFVDLFPRFSFFSVTNAQFQYTPNAPKDLRFDSLKWEEILRTATNFSQEDLPNIEQLSTDLQSFNIPGVSSELASFSSKYISNDDIPNFFQGIIYTCIVGGFIPLIITGIWSVCLGFVCCYCCCRTCICKPKSKKDPTFKTNNLFFGCQCGLRLFSAVFSIFTIIVMVAWGFLAYQSHVGISNTIDTVDSKYSTVMDYTKEVMKIPTNFYNLTKNTEKVFNETVDDLLGLLPIGDALTPHIQCIDDIVASLPNLTVITDFVDTLNSSLSTLPDLTEFDLFSGNISIWIDKMKYTDLVALETQLSSTITILQTDVPGVISTLTTELGGLDSMKAAFPTSSELLTFKENVQKLKSIQGILSDSFVATFTARLDDPTNTAASDIANDLLTFQGVINILDTVNFSPMTSALSKVSTGLSLKPNIDTIVTAINTLDTKLGEISLSGISTSLLGLNTSIYGLIDVLGGIDTLVSNLNTTVLSLIPDFTPLTTELSKIEVTLQTATCVNNITAMITTLNSTIVILPSSMSDMVLMVTNMLGSFNTTLDFDSIMGTITEMTTVVNGQIQAAMVQVGNVSVEAIFSSMPNISEIIGLIDSTSSSFDAGMSSLNVTELLGQVTSMNSTFAGIPDADYSSEISLLSGNVTTIVAQNSSITAAYNLYYTASLGAPFKCIAVPTCSDTATGMKALLQATKAAMDAVPADDMLTFIDTLNTTVDSIPASNSITAPLGTLNTTLQGLPDLNGMLSTITSANTTISEALPFDQFSSYISMFSTALDGFDISSVTGSLDSVAPIYEQINSATGMFGMFANLTQMVDPLLEQAYGMFSMVSEQLVSINSTVEEVSGYLETATSYKDMILNDYILKYDGYRLLGTLLLILLIAPIPAYTIFACFCSRRPWPLQVGSCILVLITMLLWLAPAIGIPVAIALDEGCNGGVEKIVNEVFSTAGKAADSYEFNITEVMPTMSFDVNFTDILDNGITKEFVDQIVDSQLPMITNMISSMMNMTVADLDINIDFQPIVPKDIVMNYISTTGACNETNDVLFIVENVLNSTVHQVVNATKAVMKGFKLEMGEMGEIQIHPTFPDTLEGIFLPVISQLTSMTKDSVKGTMSCAKINGLYTMFSDTICTQFRFSFIYFVCILSCLAIIFLCVTFVSTCIYLSLDCLSRKA